MLEHLFSKCWKAYQAMLNVEFLSYVIHSTRWTVLVGNRDEVYSVQQVEQLEKSCNIQWNAKPCVTSLRLVCGSLGPRRGGGGILPMIAHIRRIRLKVIPFPGFRYIEWFSYDLEMKTREKNRNNKRTEIEWFDWFIERIQTRVAFGWLSERSGEKTSCPRTF